MPVADDPTPPSQDPPSQDPQDPAEDETVDDAGGCSTSHGTTGAAFIFGAIFFVARRRRSRR